MKELTNKRINEQTKERGNAGTKGRTNERMKETVSERSFVPLSVPSWKAAGEGRVTSAGLGRKDKTSAGNGVSWAFLYYGHNYNSNYKEGEIRDTSTGKGRLGVLAREGDWGNCRESQGQPGKLL